MTFEELQKIVYDAGIVGAGGAGFPTHRKFSDKVKQIIVNAAEICTFWIQKLLHRLRVQR